MSNAKIISLSQAEMDAEHWKSNGKTVVFTNGVFDIMHKGHCQYLKEASKMGDRLIIGLNSDASVKRLGKGDKRPINDQDARAFVLSCLYFIDAIVVFDQDTPLEIIQVIKPNILVKGGDYYESETDKSSDKYIVGSDIVKEEGGKVRTIDLVEGYSTTSIIEKMKNG
ncbi:MAG: D-glycero-beta-D-manno-heptose 1-phosphate adenylyltransferase [Flavobacteriales bacterium]|nr:D-glycero-beta-D-manno-heptose 1-phosphate adenylyltransferase [Flavobacteriales bacterium]